jgi:hypothetical protein
MSWPWNINTHLPSFCSCLKRRFADWILSPSSEIKPAQLRQVERSTPHLRTVVLNKNVSTKQKKKKKRKNTILNIGT